MDLFYIQNIEKINIKDVLLILVLNILRCHLMDKFYFPCFLCWYMWIQTCEFDAYSVVLGVYIPPGK